VGGLVVLGEFSDLFIFSTALREKMAANYWTSSSYSTWTMPSHKDEDKDTLNQKIAYSELIVKLGKRMQCRQQVLATAITYFHRFYFTFKTGNTIDTSPALLAAGLYLLLIPFSHVSLLGNKGRREPPAY
jgi:hypothetical protein